MKAPTPYRGPHARARAQPAPGPSQATTPAPQNTNDSHNLQDVLNMITPTKSARYPISDPYPDRARSRLPYFSRRPPPSFSGPDIEALYLERYGVHLSHATISGKTDKRDRGNRVRKFFKGICGGS